MDEIQDTYATKEELKVIKDDFEPHKIHKHISKALKEQATLQTAVKEFIKTTLKNDVETQDLIKDIIWKNWKSFIVFSIPILGGVLQIISFFIKNP